MKKFLVAFALVLSLSLNGQAVSPPDPVNVDQLVSNASAMYASQHPEESTGPSGSGLRAAIVRGAQPQQAADAAFYFAKNAEFPDGTVYSSGYNAWVLDHNAGEGDGYCYGCSTAQFNSRYKVSTFLATGETMAMRQAASQPGLTWEQSLAIDPFLDYAFSQKFAAAKAAQASGAAASAAARISALEKAVAGLQAKLAARGK